MRELHCKRPHRVPLEWFVLMNLHGKGIPCTDLNRICGLFFKIRQKYAHHQEHDIMPNLSKFSPRKKRNYDLCDCSALSAMHCPSGYKISDHTLSFPSNSVLSSRNILPTSSRDSLYSLSFSVTLSHLAGLIHAHHLHCPPYQNDH